MKAMILAAGRGERLIPLTDNIPKPLLMAGKYPLIEHHLNNLRQCGITEVVINLSWLGEKIRETIGDGSRFQLNICYSDEGDEALETAGGIIKALPLLGDDPFIVINGDIWSDYDLRDLAQKKTSTEAHLVLVDNPDHNDEGDFSLSENMVSNSGNNMLTYSGIGLYTKIFFKHCSDGKATLAPILREKIDADLVSGEHYDGLWTDVGTIERLNQLNTLLAQ